MLVDSGKVTAEYYITEGKNMKQEQRFAYRLGLDLGTSSIGTAVYRIDKQGNTLALEHLDSYIFGEPVAPKEMQTLNTARRSARLIRRQVERKAARLKKIGYIAQSLGIMRQDLLNDKNDVIELRARAVTEKISIPQLVKVCCHIVKNRGYKGTLSQADRGTIGKKIKQTQDLLTENKTLGQLLWEEKQKASKGQAWRKIEDDGTFVYRQKIEEEFERIWDEQAKHHPELNGSYTVWGDNMFPDFPNQREISLKNAFYSAMFYQRPIKWAVAVVGNCPLFPSEKRASCAQMAYQHYRLAKEIANLRYMLPSSSESVALTPKQQQDLFNYININTQEYKRENNTIPFAKIYEILSFPDKTYFTIHRGSKKGIKGNTTLAAFEQAGLLNAFENLTDAVQELVLEFLSNITDMSTIADNTPEYIRKKLTDNGEKGESLVKNIRATNEEYSQAADFVLLMRDKNEKDNFFETFELEGDRSSFSIAGLKLLTEKVQTGELNESNEAQIVDELTAKNKTYTGRLRTLDTILKQESINDPVISRALAEFYRVMTYILHKYGNPQEVVVELSRDIKNSLAHRQELEKQNTERSNERLAAIRFLQESHILVSPRNIEKYLLWEEQAHICPYSGQNIGVTQAFDEKATQIDHIIPQRGEIGGPNVFENKVLVFSNENKAKSNHLPYEWKFKEDIDSYITYQNETRTKRKKGDKTELEFGSHSPLINFVQRLENLAENKPNRYWSMRDRKYRYTQKGKLMLRKIKNLLTTPQELKQDFSNRQNQQTAWIGKIVLEWCKDICPKGVIASSGALTAYMRYALQFDKILPRVRLAENKPLYDKDNKEIDGAKWHLLFDEDLKLSDTFVDEKLAAAWEKLKEGFGQYKQNLSPEDYPHNTNDEEKCFQNFCREQRLLCSFYKRCDHRHHAVDAAIIGLCSRSMVQLANTHHAKYGTLDVIKAYDEKGNRLKDQDIAGFEIPDIPHCAKLLQNLQQRLTDYVVWHKPDHFPSGAFFDQTAYNVQKDKDGVDRFIKRAPLSSFLKANEKKTLENLDKLLFTDTIKQVIISQFRERLAQGMAQEEALCGKKDDPQDGIYYRGNKVKQVKYMYLTGRGIREFDENADKKIRDKNGRVYKSYQNGGYACIDFDAQTGKRKNLIPLWKYAQNKIVPESVIRVFIGDILFDKQNKQFYKVQKFSARAGIYLRPVTETQENNLQTSTSSIKEYIVVSNRSDIAKIKKEYGTTTPSQH